MARLTPELIEALCREASSAFPTEACGLVAAGAGGERIVPMANRAAAPGAAFEIDPGRLAAELRRLSERGERLVAFYHSHPGGAAQLSAQDRGAMVYEGRALWPGVEQIVVAVAADGPCELRAFAFDGDFREIDSASASAPPEREA